VAVSACHLIDVIAPRSDDRQIHGLWSAPPALLEIDFVTILVALVDDNQPFRQALHEKLVEDPELEIIWEASSGAEALSIAHRSQPDVMLLDISLGDMSGIDVLKRLDVDRSRVKVIALSTYNEKRFVLEMLKAGALGYVCKIDANDVFAAIHAVARGENYLSREISLILG
jgi:DNA-binding NarL/FixJ family response regulator